MSTQFTDARLDELIEFALPQGYEDSDAYCDEDRDIAAALVQFKRLRSSAGASAEPVVASDHPDFVGGVVWSPLELRWINQKLAEARCAHEPSTDYLHTQLREWWVRSNGGEDHAAPIAHILRSLIRVADGKSSGEPSGLLKAAVAVLESACSVPEPYCGNARDPVNDLRIVSGRRLDALRKAAAEANTRPPHEPGTKPVQVLGLCDKHMHIGHFPAEAVAPPMPPIETVCPWCVRSTSTKVDKP